MTEQNQQHLIEQIITWLATLPDQEAILYYIKHLPEEYHFLAWQAAREAVEQLITQKKDYFQEAVIPQFTEKIEEVDQLLFITN